MQRFWRFASPTTFLLALALAPLPWVEVQCDRNQPRRTVSGLQAAVGGVTDEVQGSSVDLSSASPWMIGYFLALVAGIAAGLRWPLSVRRCVVDSVAALAALVCLAVQILFGWWLARATTWLLVVYGLHLLVVVLVVGEWVYLRRRSREPAEVES